MPQNVIAPEIFAKLFPMACPQCQRTDGRPYRATTVTGGGTIVTLRCESCGHDWQITMTATSPAP